MISASAARWATLLMPFSVCACVGLCVCARSVCLLACSACMHCLHALLACTACMHCLHALLACTACATDRVSRAVLEGGEG